MKTAAKSMKLSEALRAFIAEYVDSVAQLEALLFLFRNANEVFDVQVMAEQLYVDAAIVTEVLERLVVLGMAGRVKRGFRYHASFVTNELVGELARCHADQLVAITALIHAK